MSFSRQPRVPAGSPEGGQFTSGSVRGLKNRLESNSLANAASSFAPPGAPSRPAPSTAELKAKLERFGQNLKAKAISRYEAEKAAQLDKLSKGESPSKYERQKLLNMKAKVRRVTGRHNVG